MTLAARRAQPALPDARATAAYVRSQLTDTGGFANKAGKPDLYYTVFGLQSAIAVDAELPKDTVREYLESFGDGDGLDLVHLSCLARAWADLPGVEIPPANGEAIRDRLNAHRSEDGGFALVPGSPGSAYGCFVAVGGLQDLGAEIESADRIAAFLDTLRTPAGGYLNETALPFPATPSTAAALTLLTSLGFDVPAASARWLADQQDACGGFHAVEGAPICDLLSTATAVHALAVTGQSLRQAIEPAADFVLRLRNDGGGFGASTLDATPDVEYTAYALVALGHLTNAG
jgi:hypothetical protein